MKFNNSAAVQLSYSNNYYSYYQNKLQLIPLLFIHYFLILSNNIHSILKYLDFFEKLSRILKVDAFLQNSLNSWVILFLNFQCINKDFLLVYPIIQRDCFQMYEVILYLLKVLVIFLNPQFFVICHQICCADLLKNY